MGVPSDHPFDTPSEYLSWDHDRLDALLVEARTAVDEGDLRRAAGVVEEFRTGLLRHIQVEEDILFPEFEERTGVRQGPTTVMRHEHEQIKKHLSAMAGALSRSDGDGFRDACDLLDSVLPPHNLKEERVLYPAVDSALDADERRALTTRLRGG